MVKLMDPESGDVVPEGVVPEGAIKVEAGSERSADGLLLLVARRRQICVGGNVQESARHCNPRKIHQNHSKST